MKTPKIFKTRIIATALLSVVLTACNDNIDNSQSVASGISNANQIVQSTNNAIETIKKTNENKLTVEVKSSSEVVKHKVEKTITLDDKPIISLKVETPNKEELKQIIKDSPEIEKASEVLAKSKKEIKKATEIMAIAMNNMSEAVNKTVQQSQEQLKASKELDDKLAELEKQLEQEKENMKTEKASEPIISYELSEITFTNQNNKDENNKK